MIAYYRDALTCSRAKGYTKRTVWIFDVAIVTTIATLIVYSAPKTMKKIIKCCRKIQEVKLFKLFILN